MTREGKFWYLNLAMKKILNAEIGVFGGSGFYSLFNKAERIKLTTPYGSPSAPVTIGEIDGKRVAFIPRHGEKHQYPPHKVPYKANIYAFKMLGVENIISPCAAGSLQPKIKPGHFVILDQFFDRTHGREDTFYNGPKTVHIAGAKPYCPNLQKIALESCKKLKIPVHKNGSVVVINGPRFSTTCESAFFAKLGYGVINMTQYPEAVLAREQEICFLGIALITDWDAGIAKNGKVKPVELSEVMKVFVENNEKSKKVSFQIIKRLPHKRDCLCAHALSGARA